MLLPPVDTTPILCIQFTESVPSSLIDCVKDRICQGCVIILSEEVDEDGRVCLAITTTQEELELEAEHIKLVKKSKINLDARISIRGESEIFMEPFTVNDKSSFAWYEADIIKAKTTQDDLSAHDNEGLFTSSDRVRLLLSILESMPVMIPDTEGEPGTDLGRSLHGRDNNSTTSRKSSLTHSSANVSNNIVRKLKQLEMKKSSSRRAIFNTNPMNEGFGPTKTSFDKIYLFDYLKLHGYLESVEPLHVQHLRDKICDETLKVYSKVPLQSIRDYYGEEVAYYFAWMNFYIYALFPPAILSVLLYFYRLHRGDNIDNCRFTPFYGLICFLWAILFTRFWSREENKLAYRWGTFQSNLVNNRDLVLRHGFKGELRKSQVTGLMEKHYPASRRRWKYLGSALVTLVLLAGAFIVMILSLNAQGYIDNGHEDEITGVHSRHPFFFASVSIFSQPGNMFDKTSSWKCFLPVILHVVLVLTMNKMYRTVAEILTEWENHETEVSHQNSLVLKRFLFEAFDAYLALFYLAFYEQDIIKLRSELVSVFNIDTFRRLLLEGVVPYVMQRIGSKGKKDVQAEAKKYDDLNRYGVSSSVILEELNKDPYEEFDDYIEMVIQFGYITLFASAYPLSSLVAIIANQIEIRLDAFKLSATCKRPRSIARNNIGTWKMLISSIVWLSAITNCLIFCFTSMQMYQYLPDYFTVNDKGEHNLKPGSGFVIIFIMFGIERLLLVSGILINLAVPDIPESVMMQEQRKAYVYYQQHQQFRSMALKGNLKEK